MPKRIPLEYDHYYRLYNREDIFVEDRSYRYPLKLYAKHVGGFCDWPYSSYHMPLSTGPTGVNREAVLAWFDEPVGVSRPHQRLMAGHPLAPEDLDH